MSGTTQILHVAIVTVWSLTPFNNQLNRKFYAICHHVIGLDNWSGRALAIDFPFRFYELILYFDNLLLNLMEL